MLTNYYARHTHIDFGRLVKVWSNFIRCWQISTCVYASIWLRTPRANGTSTAGVFAVAVFDRHTASLPCSVKIDECVRTHLFLRSGIGIFSIKLLWNVQNQYVCVPSITVLERNKKPTDNTVIYRNLFNLLNRTNSQKCPFHYKWGEIAKSIAPHE
jgi:hypothetical protein